jgi:hypothetical protein
MKDVALISASSGFVPEYNSSKTQKCKSSGFSEIQFRISLQRRASA